MKKLLIVLIMIIGCLNLWSFGEKEETSDTKIADEMETLLEEANSQVGLPNIINFYEKKLLAMLYELRDKEDLICYAYFFNSFEGKIGDFIGKCIGFGLPYAVQFSNPEKEIYRGGYKRGFGSMPQAEPNGLFMPDSLSATWLMLIDPKTEKAKPVYIEPLIIVSPFPLK